jgi:hypothetical protein
VTDVGSRGTDCRLAGMNPQREDWARYNVDRDNYMADNVLSDLHGRPALQRHALFIIGHAHVNLNFMYGERRLGRYGLRSAISGSTRAARRAGT